MRLISVLIEIEDNDFIEQKLFKSLDGLLGVSMKDYAKLPDTKELYDTDDTFKTLCKAEKIAKQAKKDYIYKQQLKPKQ